MGLNMSTASRDKILIVSLQAIGNTILLLPIIDSLAKKGGKEISVVVADNGADSVLKNNPNIFKLYYWHVAESDFSNIVRLREELSTTLFDIAYAAFPNWTRENVVHLICRAKIKRACHADKRFLFDRLLCSLFADRIDRQNNTHDIVHNMRLFQILPEGIDFKANHFKFSPDEDIEMEALLLAKYVKPQAQTAVLVGIHPGSQASEKWWGGDKYAALARRILHILPSTRFLIFGGKAELPLMRSVSREIGDSAQIVESLSLRQCAWLIQHCRLFIGNDSALAHLAGVSSVPSIVVFGPSNPHRVAPVGNGTIAIRKEFLCSPCSDSVADVFKSCSNSLKCTRDLSVQEVSAVAEQYLRAIISGKGESVLASLSEYANIKSIEVLDIGATVVRLKSV